MRIAIASDIHGNLWALNAVLEHMEKKNVDKRICLGDIVGYGPYPNECVEEVVQKFNYIVKGNHDEATYNKQEADSFTPKAKEAIEWTKRQIGANSREVLRNLEYGFMIEDMLFVHGSPHAPFAYLNDMTAALNAFNSPISEFKVAFVGHTHVPAIWESEEAHKVDKIRIMYSNSNPAEIADYEFWLGNKEKTIINVGAVGQPRDGDNRASYAIFDTEENKVEFYRIPYSVDRTIAKMQRLAFSTESWSRLLYGQ